jgi:hypothetical protein
MHIQLRTLTFYSRPEEQLQECLHLKTSVTSLSVVIRVLGSPLGPHPESDLTIYLYSGSTSIAIMNEFDHWISFNCLKIFATSLPVMIGALDSPLGPHPKRDLATNLHSSSTPIANMDESNRWIRFRWLQEIYNITTRGDQGIWLSSRIPSENRSCDRSILWICHSSPLWRDESKRLQWPFWIIKHLADLSLSWGRLTQ